MDGPSPKVARERVKCVNGRLQKVYQKGGYHRPHYWSQASILVHSANFHMDFEAGDDSGGVGTPLEGYLMKRFVSILATR